MYELKKVIEAVSEKYVSLHVFDLRKNCVDVIKTTDHIEKWSAGIEDIQELIFYVMEHSVDEDSLEKIHEFVDFQTLDHRLKGKSMISCDFHGLVKEWCRASFIRVDRSEPIQQVLYVVEDISAVVRDRLAQEKELEEHRQALAQEAVNRDHSIQVFSGPGQRLYLCL